MMTFAEGSLVGRDESTLNLTQQDESLHIQKPSIHPEMIQVPRPQLFLNTSPTHHAPP